MLPNYLTTGVRTTKGSISTIDTTNVVTSKRTDLTKAAKRGNVKTMFAGAVAHNSSNSTQPLTAIISVVGTVTRVLDEAVVQIGESTVWNEQDFAIVLGEDEYVSVTVSETLVINDKLNVFIHAKEVL